MNRLMQLAADRLTPGDRVSDRILSWDGDVSSSSQSIPLRLAGALHAIKRRGEPHLIAVYPPNKVSDADLWGAVHAVLQDRAEEILTLLESPPQTNEVRRSAALIPVLHLLTERFGMPIHLSELGCSAGLNLRADQFHLTANGVSYGDPSARVRLTPEWEGEPPKPAPVQVSSRAGVDLSPIDPEQDAERLLAYLWPDQPERHQLTAAAIETARAHPAAISKGDAGPWLEAELSKPQQGTVHLVFHTVAWQYFPLEVQEQGKAVFAYAGARATAKAPLARFAMEADGGRGAGLSLQVWPEGATLDLGRADFHGRWIEWRPPWQSP